ncbi:MAG TPA: MEDS domain-containing protein [Solirubrobacteraceae bacterium]|jgi:anti-sigma regulatory factor (Ser/Thr protein kinase)
MIETECSDVRSGEHVVLFYEHDAELAKTVGRYLADAIDAGGSAVMIATEAHRQAFEAELEAAGIDVAQAAADDTLVSLDAAHTLGSFMPSERIDPDAFRRVLVPIIQSAAQGGRPVRSYGEMVPRLWDDGDVVGAIELEGLWSQLGGELPFSLLCGYRTTSVSAPEHAEALDHICQLHSSVLPASRDAGQPDRHSGPAVIEVSRQFRPELDAPRAARGFVADALRRWGHGETLLQDSQLVVSELATNAVVHARSPFSVVARREGSGVRLSVHDLSTAQPVLRSTPDVLALSGRGLQLVAHVTSEWGVETTSAGKTVWAELRDTPVRSGARMSDGCVVGAT